MMVMIKMMLMVVIDPLQTAVVDNPHNDDINDIINLNYISTTLVQC